jgi:hypothetical protein
MRIKLHTIEIETSLYVEMKLSFETLECFDQAILSAMG